MISRRLKTSNLGTGGGVHIGIFHIPTGRGARELVLARAAVADIGTVVDRAERGGVETKGVETDTVEVEGAETDVIDGSAEEVLEAGGFRNCFQLCVI